MTAKSYQHVVVLAALVSAAGAATADKQAAVDLVTARNLVLSQTPQVPWLVHEVPMPLGSLDLASLVPKRAAVPEANSEQRQPLTLNNPHAPPGAPPRIPGPLRPLLEKQGLWLLEHLGLQAAEFELWPTQNEVGRLTWVFSRYRKSEGSPWQWLDADLQREHVADDNLVHDPLAILPEHLSPASRRGSIAIFRDFLAPDTRDLYEKPRFSECLWTNADKSAALAAWRPSVERAAQRLHFEKGGDAEKKGVWCLALPQPARFGGRPLTLHLQVAASGKVALRELVEWAPAPVERVLPLPVRQAVKTAPLPTFPPRFDEDYQKDVEMLSGKTPLPTGLRLVRKNSADPQHQLEDLLDYLEGRYHKLGLGTYRQRFTYRGIPQSNLIAFLPADDTAPVTPKDGAGLPTTTAPVIILADHVDTAFCEDVFARTDDRVSAPGADDNASATAALLRAAEVLRQVPREQRHHDIWILHLTGEEFPADDLGARHFVAELGRSRVEVGALLLLDMIGYNPRNGRELQLNAGGYLDAGWVSMRIAQLASRVTSRVTPTLRPLLYPPTDLRNYLYNTDGVVFAEQGIPVVLWNEVMNRYMLSRAGYHDAQDTMENLNVSYAANIARSMIATAAVLAQLRVSTFEGPPMPNPPITPPAPPAGGPPAPATPAAAAAPPVSPTPATPAAPAPGGNPAAPPPASPAPSVTAGAPPPR